MFYPVQECSLELIHEECVLLEEEDDAMRTDLHVKIQLCVTKKEGLSEELRQLKGLCSINRQGLAEKWQIKWLHSGLQTGP